MLCLKGQVVGGWPAIDLATASGDPKKINWDSSSAYDGGSIQAGTTGKGMVIDASSSAKLALMSSGHGGSATLDFGGASNSIIAIPNTNGSEFTMLTSQDLGPGKLTRTIPAAALNEVDIGTFAAGGGSSPYSGTWEAYIIASNGNEWVTKTYHFGMPPGYNGWHLVVPLTDSGPGTADGHGTNFALEANALSLRLRRTGGDGSAIPVYITLYGNNGTGFTFTPSTGTATVSDPGAALLDTVITSVAGKAAITNAHELVATIDPVNLTAPQTITLPNWSGTPSLDGGTTFTASGCASSSFVGGAVRGQFVSGDTSGACSITVTMGDLRTSAAFTSHWYCSLQDLTAPADLWGITASTATTATFLSPGVSTSGHTVSFSCLPY